VIVLVHPSLAKARMMFRFAKARARICREYWAAGYADIARAHSQAAYESFLLAKAYRWGGVVEQRCGRVSLVDTTKERRGGY
jgi:hypothetical protein